MGSKKRKAGEGVSQPRQRVKCKATRRKLLQSLTDDDIETIAMKVDTSTEDVLAEFQQKQQNYVVEMVKEMTVLQTSIAKLHTNHSPSTSQQE